jgi:hypothetical protein
VRGKPAIAKIPGIKHPRDRGSLPIGLPAAPAGTADPSPTGVGFGESGTIYFSSGIENAIYKVTRK